MVRQVQRLNALAVRNAKPGLLPDGDGLYLQVTKSGSRSWIYRYFWSGKSRDMGLGSVKSTSLAEARDLAARYRKIRQSGRDPIAEP
jgi:Arm DNA-binding domain